MSEISSIIEESTGSQESTPGPSTPPTSIHCPYSVGAKIKLRDVSHDLAFYVTIEEIMEFDTDTQATLLVSDGEKKMILKLYTGYPPGLPYESMFPLPPGYKSWDDDFWGLANQRVADYNHCCPSTSDDIGIAVSKDNDIKVPKTDTKAKADNKVKGEGYEERWYEGKLVPKFYGRVEVIKDRSEELELMETKGFLMEHIEGTNLVEFMKLRGDDPYLIHAYVTRICFIIRYLASKDIIISPDTKLEDFLVRLSDRTPVLNNILKAKYSACTNEVEYEFRRDTTIPRDLEKDIGRQVERFYVQQYGENHEMFRYYEMAHSSFHYHKMKAEMKERFPAVRPIRPYHVQEPISIRGNFGLPDAQPGERPRSKPITPSKPIKSTADRLTSYLGKKMKKAMKASISPFKNFIDFQPVYRSELRGVREQIKKSNRAKWESMQ